MLDREEVCKQVMQATDEVAASVNVALAKPISGNTVLLDCGLDSLGFAMLVAALEEKLAYDPFVLSNTATYPVTFDQFIDFYFKHQPES